MSGRAWGAEIQSREEKFEIKRQAVLRAAASLFRDKGTERTTLSDIADVLHVSKPTVYYYFRNKEEVLLALIEAAVSEFTDPALHPEDYPLAPNTSGADRLGGARVCGLLQAVHPPRVPGRALPGADPAAGLPLPPVDLQCS